MGVQNFEQQVNLFHGMCVYCAIAALGFLIIAAALFFLFRILEVVGELTGRKAKRAIDEMTAENAVSGSLTSRRIGEDGRRHRRKGRTGALATGRLRRTSGRLVMPDSHRDQSTLNQDGSTTTDELYDCGSTPENLSDTLGSKQTDVLDQDGSTPTDVLSSHIQITTELEDPTELNAQESRSETVLLNQSMIQSGERFVIERSIVEIHTDEVI